MNTPLQELIPLSSADRWTSILQGIPHHYSHTLEHCSAMHLSTGYPTFLYTFQLNERRIICPVSERTFNGFTDIVTPYGFNGFIANGDCPEFNDHWKSYISSKGYICGYFGMNPLIHYNLGFEQGELSTYNEIYVLDLTKSTNEIIDAMSDSRKGQLRKLNDIRNKLSLDKERLTSYFLDHYERFMEQKKASKINYFSRPALKMIVEQENVFLAGYIDNGEVHAVSVFGYTKHAGDYLMNIHTEHGKMAGFALIWLAIERLKQMNVPILNLGGGVAQGDSLARFKKRFGGGIHELANLKQVYHPSTFQRLCHIAGVDSQQPGYFPPYRTMKY